MSSSNTAHDHDLALDTNKNVVIDPTFLPYAITQTPFLLPSPHFVPH